MSTGPFSLAALGRVAARVWVPLALVIAWQLWVSVSGVSSLVVPAPLDVAGDLLSDPGAYVHELRVTLVTAGLGLVLGMALGFVLALLGWLNPFFSGMTTPVAMMLRTIPIAALIPVIGRVVGYDVKSVVVVTVLITIFPAFVFATSGLRTAPAGADDLFGVLRSSRFQRLRRLAVPASVPNLLTALRISSSMCILGALVAEWLIGTDGLGHELNIARIEFRVERLWGIAVVSCALSVAAFLAATGLERWGTARWS